MYLLLANFNIADHYLLPDILKFMVDKTFWLKTPLYNAYLKLNTCTVYIFTYNSCTGWFDLF